MQNEYLKKKEKNLHQGQAELLMMLQLPAALDILHSTASGKKSVRLGKSEEK